MTFIDTHTHLYLNQFDTDIIEVITKAQQNGIEQFFLPAIDSQTHEQQLKLEKQYPNTCFSMMGLHPCSVNERVEEELTLIEHYLQQRYFCAIGEIGLDYYWDTSFAIQQQQAFTTQMDWALQYNIPINIHTRKAMQQTINMVKPYAAKGLTGIFHCFGDDYNTAKQIINMGFYLGIGGVLTYPKAGLQETMKKVGLEHVVLETDSPYLTPVPYRGKRNESNYIKIIATKLAELKEESVEEVAWVTTQNAKKIFKVN